MKKSLGARTLICPSPVWCIGSYDDKGKPNVMTASWAGICCSDPPCVAVSLRKATLTHGNIMRSKVFTVSVPSKKHAKEADYFGLVSGKTVNKFEATGLTPVKGDRVNAPYVGEFPMAVECRVLHIFELGLHTQFVGEILDVKVDEEILSKGGLPDMQKLDPFHYSAADQLYYATGKSIGAAFDIGEK
ncbi:MAG: flavin reductase family protein [Elusimicrobia bacterium]|nr:flavin reductase family protein [Candidatus Obscuribacterium magneticum]